MQHNHQLFRRLALIYCLGFGSHSALAQNGDGNTDWRYHGNDNYEQRFSPLKTINTGNVENLGLAWYMDLPTARGQESTPLIIDGVMYTSAAWSHVYAIDAKTGEQLWHYDPKVDKSVRVKGCCGPVNRGVAYDNGKVFIGAFDGRLIALDAKTGKELWSEQTVDTTKNYTITGAPRVANGKVFIGNGGAEFGVRGYVSAYDQESGKMVWRFYTVPGDPSKPQENPILEKVVKTWDGEFWKIGGGGTVWDSMAFDPELNLLYIGVGNGSPWNPKLRTNGKGDNYFLSSIVALDVDTGKYVWHYQTTPQEGWDYTATQHMILADLTIDGKERKVIMQAPKNGFFFVIDRVTGEFISADNFVPATWTDGFNKTGRAIVKPEAKYWETDKPVLTSPSWTGGHSWHPMSYNPGTELVYLPAQEMSFPYMDIEKLTVRELAVNLGVDITVAGFPDDPEIIKAIKAATKGHLAAWDPVAQKEVWRVQYPGMWNGGVLSTAGNLVFQGSAAGYMYGYDARTGAKLWEYPVQSGVIAAPVTYEIDGEQYVSISVGWGGIYPLMTGPMAFTSTDKPVNRSRLLTFKLSGTAQLPPKEEKTLELQDLTAYQTNPEDVHKGMENYELYCAGCHGTGAVGGGLLPDLRYTPALTNQAWNAVIEGGALSSRGMVSFSKELSTEDVEQIRQYVIERNKFARKIGQTKRAM
ncbi:MAG: PQQ-dependent dehydrogenase, methanol/ethanol family [Oceanospirillum sp.]|mgnify:CR=1 FL=1|nr:PQQ-dependent dehydrogenase, methanol/ethanol family [Oceanospirillum sp.]